MSIVISILLICLAGICKAVADTLQHHYDTSVFKNMTPKFWNPLESYKYVKYLPLTKYRPDAWHLANSGMIVCFIVSASVDNTLAWHWFALIAGVSFNVVFNIFYNKILRRKH